MYGAPATVERLEWTWVDEQLATAGAYWVVTAGSGRPHPRPVWGVWHGSALALSIGSPALRAAAEPTVPVTVHLGSELDVVVVEGSVVGPTADPDLLDEYDRKYDWSYAVEQYGPLTRVVPHKVLAWRSAGWAGRDGFRAAGRWTFHR
jgi:hypothetical protein